MPWLFLSGAIAAEVAGTLQLRALATASNRWWPIVAIVCAYGLSFAFMTLALRQIRVGAVYAIWSGAGTAAVALFGQWLFGERITWRGAIGMALIVAGVAVLVLSGPRINPPAGR
jgi:small multidrug resistance pump